MKATKIYFTSIIVILLSMQSFALDFEKVKNINFNNKSDIEKYTPQVKEAIDYILASSIDNKSNNTDIAVELVIKYLVSNKLEDIGTNEMAQNIMKENDELINVYMACIAKSYIEANNTLNEKEIMNHSMKDFCNYCSNKNNKVKKTPFISRLISKSTK